MANAVQQVVPERLTVVSVQGQRLPAPEWESVTEIEGSKVCVITLEEAGDVPADLIADFDRRSYVVIVVGPAEHAAWRNAAVAAGAFGCLSRDAALEDKLGMVRSAARHQAARSQLEWLRSHHDRLCSELVQSFGNAMKQLSEAKSDAGDVRSSLQEMRFRVIRALM
jgi:hypothetical protein